MTKTQQQTSFKPSALVLGLVLGLSLFLGWLIALYFVSLLFPSSFLVSLAQAMPHPLGIIAFHLNELIIVVPLILLWAYIFNRQHIANALQVATVSIVSSYALVVVVMAALPRSTPVQPTRLVLCALAGTLITPWAIGRLQRVKNETAKRTLVVLTIALAIGLLVATYYIDLNRRTLIGG